MKVLVINCGSSSLKYQLIDSETESVLAKGLCERIGIDGALTHQPAGKDKIKSTPAMPDHKTAIGIVIDQLTDKENGVVESLDEIGAVGHRVVHGGEKFAKSVVVTPEVKAAIAECNDLAPLHNPANLIGIEACESLMPGTPQVVVFDTAFHQTMPEKAYMYGLPYEYYEKYKVRRYGFHGTSHSFVSKRVAEIVGKPYNATKTIVCHLGNGASAKKENLDIAGIMNVLNKKSGVEGVSGVSSDFRDLEAAAKAGNKRAELAIDVFAYRVAKYVGAYTAAMNGVDNIVFTAGIGENCALVRTKVCSYLGYLGITIDEEANGKRGEEIVISTPDSKVKVLVVPTNEELAIARETVALV